MDKRMESAERARLAQFRNIYGEEKSASVQRVNRKKDQVRMYDAVESRRDSWTSSTKMDDYHKSSSISKSAILLDIERHEHRAKAFLSSLEMKSSRPPTPPSASEISFSSSLISSRSSENFDRHLRLLENSFQNDKVNDGEDNDSVILIGSANSSNHSHTLAPSSYVKLNSPAIVSNIVDMSLADLRCLFSTLDDDRDGAVSLPQLRKFLRLKTLEFTRFRGWLRLAPRDIRIDDAFFAHMSKFCVADEERSFMTFDMFAASVASLREKVPSTFWTSSMLLHDRVWTRESVMRGWTERLRDVHDICGVHILRRNVLYGNQIGTLLMIPSELLRICFALVNDSEGEFYDAYRGVDSNVWGYNALIDILDDLKTTKRRESPDGVFCFATYDNTNSDLLNRDQDTLLSVSEEIKSTATRYQGVYRSIKNIKGERWTLRIKRAEQLDAKRGVGAFASMNILRVTAKSAEMSGGFVSRDMIGDGDLSSPPLLLKTSNDSVRKVHFESRVIVDGAFPGNAFVNLLSGRLVKKTHHGVSDDNDDPRREFVREITSTFHRFLPRKHGQRTAV